MSILALIAGIIMFATGVIALPHAPASPEAIRASQALSAFFFGGAFIICAIFARVHPRHGKPGIFVIATLGVCTALTGLIPEFFEGKNVALPVVLLLVSLPLTILAFRRWKKSRRILPDESP